MFTDESDKTQIMRVAHLYVRNFRGIKSMSWNVKSNFNCIIGAGDTGKTTILTALDYALSPRHSITFDDSDFYEQNVDERIVIQVTLTDWDESQPEVQKFFREKDFAHFKCGLNDDGPVPEPGEKVAVSVALNVDKSLEPKWFVVKGRDDDDSVERKALWGTHRNSLGVSRIDVFSDYHFTWGNNTILTRLSADNEGNPNAVLSELARDMRQSDISKHPSVAECQTIADTVKSESKDAGVGLATLAPKIDVQRRSMTGGVLSLHEGNVPLRNKGSGSKRLIATAMQMKLNDGKNISLIDELEAGLEPHRIRGLIQKLKKSGQQIFTTTHSPVVLRELSVDKNELLVSARDNDGSVMVIDLATVPNIQRSVWDNAEAFLGSKVIACEGETEIGCLRAYDKHRFALDTDTVPVWSLATSYFDCKTLSQVKRVSPKLLELGYRVGVFCDNDDPKQLSEGDVETLVSLGVHVCRWDPGNSTEKQLFLDIPWDFVPELLEKIAQNHERIQHATIVDNIRKAAADLGVSLQDSPSAWKETKELRQVIGKAAEDGKWIKRWDYAAKAFWISLPKLSERSVIKMRMNDLWEWIQDE